MGVDPDPTNGARITSAAVGYEASSRALLVVHLCIYCFSLAVLFFMFRKRSRDELLLGIAWTDQYLLRLEAPTSSRTVFLSRLIGLYGIPVALSIIANKPFSVGTGEARNRKQLTPCFRRAMGNRASEGVRFRIFPLCRNSSSGPNRGGSTCYS
jgi:hypothetical protein